MKAYIATVIIEMPIYAENEKEATKVAEKFFIEEVKACPPADLDFSIKPMNRCPDGSNHSESCWSSKEDETISILEGINLNGA